MLKKMWLWFLFWFVKGLISIRYRVRIRGLETLTPEALSKKGGILFLPNHPAQIDPVIILIAMWQRFHPRPIVVENYYYLAVAHYFMKLIQALPLPDLNGMVSKWKQKKIEKTFNYVSEELRKGSNFLIYPSGKLKISAAEMIGGASFVHNLLKACPDTNIVLIRTTGLWGSRFSRAITGMSPNFGAVMWESFKIVLKNAVLLTPRRDVLIEVEPAGARFPYSGTRLEVNQYLEKWYNINGPEPLKLVSDLFWKKSYSKIKAVKEADSRGEKFEVPAEVEKGIYLKIAELSHKKPEEINRSQHLATEIGLDSLDVAQLYVFLDERHDVEELTPGQLQTVEDVLRAAVGKEKKVETVRKEKSDKPKWPNEPSRPAVGFPEGKTLQEAFLKVCDKMDSHAACADGVYGVITYRRLKLMALILARRIRKMEGKYIGILLPSSTAAYLLIFATLLAKKIPVMLNWTVGVRALDHCAKLCDVKIVLSSRRFLNNLNNGDFGMVDDLLVLLEDLKEEVSFRDKLIGFWDALKDAGKLLEKFTVDENDPAVVLFTSGTETLPKGVPLSHANLLANHRAALSCVDFQKKDVLYGVLPPFHSFGFSVTGLLPILAGLRAYYAPDPTDSHGVAHDISSWNATLFCCAPTFIKGLFRVAKSHQLENLRYIVSGAEKTPQEFFEYVAKIPGHHHMLEGYGITECGPIVTLTRPGKPPHGVGQPVPGVELFILEPDEKGEGEVCIRGPNVFHGYLGSQKSPFANIEGKEWYLSGDRGRIEADGTLILSGRLKRFVKIGGEMVSLGGLEEEILRLATERKWLPSSEQEGPPLAVGVAERESEKPRIILFATFNVSKDDVNAALRENGYGRIAKISEVRKVSQIPLTGTGKTHYRALDEMVNT